MNKRDKPIYTVFADRGIKKDFLSKKAADAYAKDHGGLVIHTGWTVKKSSYKGRK